MPLIYNKAKVSKAAADWVVYKNVQHQASVSAYSNATQQMSCYSSYYQFLRQAG